MSVGYGRFVPRAVALLIDLIIVGVLAGAVTGLLGVGSRGLLASAVAWLYFAGQESGPRMATLGKRAMGLAVQGVDGRRLDFGRASLRWIARWLSGLALGLGYLLALFSERRQTLHDLIAGSVVVQR